MAQPPDAERQQLSQPEPPFRTVLFPPSATASPSNSTIRSNAKDSGRCRLDLRHFPVSFRDGPYKEQIKVLRDGETLTRFLEIEFSLKRLDIINHKLWLVGLPRPPRTLAAQSQLGRTVVLTNDLDMHLVWGNGKIYLKPLPRYLLDPLFWEKNPFRTTFPATSTGMTGSDSPPRDSAPSKETFPETVEPSERPRLDGSPSSQGDRASALGLLYTYACLITHPVDMKIAVDLGLMPGAPDWPTWRRLAAELLRPEISSQAHRRFSRSELRLDRLNWIYIFQNFCSFRLYRRPWENYTEVLFFSLSWVAAPILYIALVLNAMQVGLATNVLEKNDPFHKASYGFSIFAIMAPIIGVIFVVAVLLVPMVANWIVARTAGRGRGTAGRRPAKANPAQHV